MTKKILHSPDESGSSSEFLVPIKKSAGFVLVGIASGKEYEQGMVVFTGKELTSSMLAAKAEMGRVPVNLALFNAYLEQVRGFKISKLVGVKAGKSFELEQA